MVFSIGVKQSWEKEREKTIFKQIEEECYKKVLDQMNQEFAKILNIKVITVEVQKGISRDFLSLTIDKYTINYIAIDQYNNLSCEIPQKIPIEYLIKIRRFLNEYLEHQDSHYHRTGTSFLIYYFEQHTKELTIDEITQICEMDDVDCEYDNKNFREWLVGTSYSSDGNLKSYRPDLSYDLFKRENKKVNKYATIKRNG